jgi:hypothetical protein
LCRLIGIRRLIGIGRLLNRLAWQRLLRLIRIGL